MEKVLLISLLLIGVIKDITTPDTYLCMLLYALKFDLR